MRALVIPILLILLSGVFAQLDPRTLDTSVVFEQMKEILKGIVENVKSQRAPYLSLPEENQIRNLIDMELDNMVRCLNPNPEPIVNAFRLIPAIYELLGSPNPQIENVDSMILASQVYDAFYQGYNAIIGCLPDSIVVAPYLSDLFGTVNSMTIKQKIDWMKIYSSIANNYLSEIANKYQYSMFWQCGEKMAELYIWVNPLPPPEHVHPINQPDWILWKYLKIVINGFLEVVTRKRQQVYYSNPQEQQKDEIIVNEVMMIKSCLDANPNPFTNVFRQWGSVFQALGAPNYHFETADINYLSERIHSILQEGVDGAIRPCAGQSTVVMPYLNELRNTVTVSSIREKLNSMISQSTLINDMLNGISNNFEAMYFYYSGNGLGELYFLINPINASPSNPSPADFPTSELILQIVEIVNGLVETIIQTRQAIYYSDPNEYMVAQAIRSEVQSLMQCLQANPEPIANTFKMFVDPFNTLGAPNPHFESADKYTLANQIYNIFMHGLPSINGCTYNLPTIQPFIMTLSSSASPETIRQKLDNLNNQAMMINENLQQIMNNYGQAAYRIVGDRLGQLWFIANPLNPYTPPGPSSDVSVNGIPVARAEIVMHLYSADNTLLKTIDLSNNH